MVIIYLIVLLIILLLLFKNYRISSFSAGSTGVELIYTTGVPFIISYTIPNNNGGNLEYFKWPLLYLIDTSNSGNQTASFFNNNKEYLKPPPKVLTNSDYVLFGNGESTKYSPEGIPLGGTNNPYYPNLINTTNINDTNMFLATESSNPKIPPGVVQPTIKNNTLRGGDVPYWVFNSSSSILNAPLVIDQTYVMGIALQMNKPYINIKATIKNSSDPLIKYRYTNFNYIDVIFKDGKINTIDLILSDSNIINGSTIV